MEDENRLRNTNHLILPLEEELQLLKELNSFPLGQFLLKNKGLDGYWTSFVLFHKPDNMLTSPLEQWFFTSSPALKATRERFFIFQKKLQENLKSKMTLASVPCGLMDDLLSLDYSQTENINLVGIDLDPRALEYAQKNAQKYELQHCTHFIKKDAWELRISQEFDIVVSNGLNIYEPNDQKVIELYQQFFQSLKPGGLFITSFMTPPQNSSGQTLWQNFNAHDLLKQKALFVDILQVKWQCFRTEDQMRQHLIAAGFVPQEIIFDNQNMFPTIVAKKV
jgi:SAM-dependent methyltransferase